MARRDIGRATSMASAAVAYSKRELALATVDYCEARRALCSASSVRIWTRRRAGRAVERLTFGRGRAAPGSPCGGAVAVPTHTWAALGQDNTLSRAVRRNPGIRYRKPLRPNRSPLSLQCLLLYPRRQASRLAVLLFPAHRRALGSFMSRCPRSPSPAG